VAPVLLLWSTRRHERWKGRRIPEGVLLLVLLIFVGEAVFGGLFSFGSKHSPLEFLSIPILVWVAFRFGARDSASGALLLSAIAISGTLRGFGPFARASANESLLLLQAFMGVVSMTSLALAAVVSERRRVEESLRLLESAVDDAVEGVVILSARPGYREPRISFVNQGFSQMTGLSSSEVLGESLEILGFVKNDRGVFGQLRRAFSEGARFESEARAVRRDGSQYALELRLTPVPGGAERPTHWVGILRDVTERRAHMAVLEHQALHDSLTRLPNRFLLRDRLDQAIRASERNGAPMAIFLIDLDRFKDINDAHGHQVGDALLKQIGPRLRGVLRSVDTLARLGGDEFAILLPSVGAREGATLMAERVLEAFEKPFEVESRNLKISASIGIALCPEHGTARTTLPAEGGSGHVRGKEVEPGTGRLFR